MINACLSSANGHHCLFFYLGLYNHVVGVALGDLPANLQALHISLGFEVVVGQSVTYRGSLATGHVEGLLVKLCCVSIGQVLFTDEAHQLLGLPARLVLFEQVPEHILGVV